jgi:hypothetical protein
MIGTIATSPKWKTRGCVLHYGLAIYIKTNLNAKEELWETQIFHHTKI